MQKFILFTLVIIFTISCKKNIDTPKQVLITQKVPEIKDGLMTPEALWYFGRIGEFLVSPNKKSILMTVTFYDIDENKGNSEIFIIDASTYEKKQLSFTTKSESNICWKPDGKTFGFLYPDDNDEMQLFEMNTEGKYRKQISRIKGGINGFFYSPDSKNILYTADVAKTQSQAYPDKPKANVRIIDELMYRHWDTWVESYSHIFVAPYSGNITEGIDIMKDEQWESPVRPFAGMEHITWSPDSKSIVYTCRKLKGLQYSKSTNSDLYSYDIGSKKTINLTEGMMGYDMNPVFSNDGTKMAWESMKRDGYEADKHRLFVLDMKSGAKTELLTDFDANAYNITWSDDDKTIYFTTDWFGSQEIFSVGLSENKAKRITEGIHNYSKLRFTGDKLFAFKQSMSKPIEIYQVDIKTGKDKEISFVNRELLAKLKMAKVEKRMIKTTDGQDMLTWIIYPPDFDPAKKYPTLLYCQGGPQGMVGQFWSYRWNFRSCSKWSCDSRSKPAGSDRIRDEMARTDKRRLWGTEY